MSTERIEKLEKGHHYFRCRVFSKPWICGNWKICDEIWRTCEEIVHLRPEEKIIWINHFSFVLYSSAYYTSLIFLKYIKFEGSKRKCGGTTNYIELSGKNIIIKILSTNSKHLLLFYMTLSRHATKRDVIFSTLDMVVLVGRVITIQKQ